MAAQFKVAPADPALVLSIQQELGLPRFVARTMVAHGVGSLEAAREFLAPDLERDWRDPYEIPQLGDVVDRLERAVRDGERIVVFGDFDLDGISATTVLTRGLAFLGGTAFPLIPKRFEEGYGLTPASIERAKTHDPDLIVTVDCGIACGDVSQSILDAGIDLVVTDHHEPGDLVPQGVIVCDPKCDPACESGILAGVGVALKVVQALGARFGKPHLWREYTDFATLGTVADLMPLRGENRALVADGVERMSKYPRPCLAALIEVCNVGGKPITSTGLSFSLIPRLNAAGRMGNADLALELLMADDFEQASAKAAELDAVNDERRRIEAQLAEQAEAVARETYHGQRALVVAGRGWHEGVKGIVASRLVNQYGVPVILFSIEGDEARGSGRSVGSVNLFKAVESVSDMLIRFGGHGGAVGVTVAADRIDEFARRLCDYMDSLPEDSFHPLIEVDAQVDLGELTLSDVQALSRLAPFGQTNPTPRYLARNVRLVSRRAVGIGKNHLSCQMTDGAHKVGAIMFHCGSLDTLMECDSVMNVAFQVQIDEWKGRRSVKCVLDVVEPAASCPALTRMLPADDLDFVGELYEEGRLFDDGSCCDEGSCDAVACRAHWQDAAAADPAALTDALVRELIGDEPLHDAQRAALDELAQGRSALVVMGTGRGKSLIFQVHAARIALESGAASVFVYPLRALVSDQIRHIQGAFERFGLTAAVLMGKSSPDEKRRAYAALADGSLDVVLTTPEFLAAHAPSFAACGRIRFLAIDEAHHMAARGASHREAYSQLAGVAEALGHPVVLATTATAPDEVEARVSSTFGPHALVRDAHVRDNLRIDDQRGLRDKVSYLARIVGGGEKTLVYVNSREGTVDVARLLRPLVPQVASQVGFYNAGLSRDERERIERLFREGVLRVLMCTSAFGEGVNIGDVSHVVHFSMPFSDIEFNQMSGRAGRDGREAWVHLLFGKNDATTDEGILERQAPGHDAMAQAYRTLKRLQREADAGAAASRPGSGPRGASSGDGAFFAMDDAGLAAACSSDPRFAMSEETCAFALSVFEELGLVEVRDVAEHEATPPVSSGAEHAASGPATPASSSSAAPEQPSSAESAAAPCVPPSADAPAYLLRVPQASGKVNLDDSALYREGRAEVESFSHFADWALNSPAETLRARIVSPILPQQGDKGEESRHA